MNIVNLECQEYVKFSESIILIQKFHHYIPDEFVKQYVKDETSFMLIFIKNKGNGFNNISVGQFSFQSL